MAYQKIYMNQIHSSSLLCQLSQMWRQQILCDAVIRTGTSITKAHRVVLVAACPMLQSMDGAGMGNSLEVKLSSDIQQASVSAFLQYLYDGFMMLTEDNIRDVEKIARLLQVDSVIKCCTDFLKVLDNVLGGGIKFLPNISLDTDTAEFRHVRASQLLRSMQNGADRHSAESDVHFKRKRAKVQNPSAFLHGSVEDMFEIVQTDTGPAVGNSDLNIPEFRSVSSVSCKSGGKTKNVQVLDLQESSNCQEKSSPMYQDGENLTMPFGNSRPDLTSGQTFSKRRCVADFDQSNYPCVVEKPKTLTSLAMPKQSQVLSSTPSSVPKQPQVLSSILSAMPKHSPLLSYTSFDVNSSPGLVKLNNHEVVNPPEKADCNQTVADESQACIPEEAERNDDTASEDIDKGRETSHSLLESITDRSDDVQEPSEPPIIKIEKIDSEDNSEMGGAQCHGLGDGEYDRTDAAGASFFRDSFHRDSYLFDKSLSWYTQTYKGLEQIGGDKPMQGMVTMEDMPTPFRNSNRHLGNGSHSMGMTLKQRVVRALSTLKSPIVYLRQIQRKLGKTKADEIKGICASLTEEGFGQFILKQESAILQRDAFFKPMPELLQNDAFFRDTHFSLLEYTTNFNDLSELSETDLFILSLVHPHRNYIQDLYKGLINTKSIEYSMMKKQLRSEDGDYCE